MKSNGGCKAHTAVNNISRNEHHSTVGSKNPTRESRRVEGHFRRQLPFTECDGNDHTESSFTFDNGAYESSGFRLVGYPSTFSSTCVPGEAL
ncbi:hypothetical protein GQ457_15G001830 [Hibiscus cannabinus]